MAAVLMLSSLSVQAAQTCIQDDHGREVCWNKPVQRIVTTSSNLTRLLYAAGAGSRLVGADSYSTFPENTAKPADIGSFPNFNLEQILALKPDVVLVWGQVIGKEIIERLQGLGLKVFYVDQNTIADIASSIQKLGALAGTGSVANQSAAAFTERYQKLLTTYQQRKKTRVFYEMWNVPLMTVGSKHLINEAINMCGGDNIFSDLDTGVVTVGLETVLQRNPEIIITRDQFSKNDEIPKEWAPLRPVKAVKNGMIIPFPDNLLTMPTPKMLDGIELLCQKVQAARDLNTAGKP
ncbi:cobalamin-binding protein [Sansalvadorimonas verongulae]|uniref:cobalamin-binding protein n=1 Tax=Sansalvadorimonas verongulae TaxID=2172824 RepID=UPI0018AD2E78|nr:cobalamin-binding protein [Sansalvadorimonas verongulae]